MPDYLPEHHPAYPAANQIIGNPSNSSGQAVVGAIQGRGDPRQRELLNAVDNAIIDIPKMFEFEFSDFNNRGLGRWEGQHIIDRSYFYFAGGYPHWLTNPFQSPIQHHYTLTQDLDECETYWYSVYRKRDGVDNLEALHSSGAHPVVDTAWYMQFIRTGWLVSGEINDTTPGPNVPANSWVLFAFDWSERQHVAVYVHPSWDSENNGRRFDPTGENPFYLHWPEVNEFDPAIIVRPFFP
jgi:hypothetical protein